MIAHVLRFTSLLLLVLAPSMAATHDDPNFDIRRWKQNKIPSRPWMTITATSDVGDPTDSS